MSKPIRIVWPENLLVPNMLIEKWFVEEVEKGTIAPAELSAKTPAAMAQALENAGRIRLAK